MKLQSRKQNIWFTSDTHAYHANIVRGTTAWTETDRCRDFDTIEEMTAKLVENINAVVGEDDILFHLGDWSFGGIDKIWKFRKQINCKNIHLILGNHDHHIEDNMKILPNVYEDMHSGDLKDGEPDTDNLRDIVFVYELFSSIQHYKDVSIDGIKVIMCHYAMRVWDKSHHGAIMLYGHSHGTLDEMTPDIANPTWIGDEYYIRNYRTMDVGVDTNDLKPYNWKEIKSIMEAREVGLEVDHHNKDTN